MPKTITFNELRKIKDSLPDGSTHRIADELGLSVEQYVITLVDRISKMEKAVVFILNRDQTVVW